MSNARPLGRPALWATELDCYLDHDVFRETFADPVRHNDAMSRQVKFKVVKEGASYFAVIVTGLSRQELRSAPMATKTDAFSVCETVWQHLKEPPDGPIGYSVDSLLPD